MDELGVDDGAGAGPRLHQRDEDVDQLAGLRTDDVGAEDALGLGIDQHLDQPGRLIGLDRARYPTKRQGGHLERDARLRASDSVRPTPATCGSVNTVYGTSRSPRPRF